MRGGKDSVPAGAGIDFDSDPESEYEETRMKSRAVSRALEMADGIDNLDITEAGR